MRAGRLRHRITVERDANAGADPPVTDAHGQPVEDWRAWASVWAAVEPLTGNERFAAQQVNATTTHQVTIRGLPGLLTTMRIRHDSRILDIDAVLDVEERGREMQVMCTERPNG